jgi:DNA-binding FadR family transcriptional regulator
MSTLHYQGVRATFRELVDARLVIEPIMAGLAAEAKDPELIDRLRAFTDSTRDSLDDDTSYIRGMSDFHATIAGASGNRILNLFGRSLQDVYSERISGGRMFPTGARQQVQHDHEAIVRAIENGDAKKATRLMREHMEELASMAEERYPGLLDEIVDWR